MDKNFPILQGYFLNFSHSGIDNFEGRIFLFFPNGNTFSDSNFLLLCYEMNSAFNLDKKHNLTFFSKVEDGDVFIEDYNSNSCINLFTHIDKENQNSVESLLNVYKSLKEEREEFFTNYKKIFLLNTKETLENNFKSLSQNEKSVIYEKYSKKIERYIDLVNTQIVDILNGNILNSDFEFAPFIQNKKEFENNYFLSSFQKIKAYQNIHSKILYKEQKNTYTKRKI